MSYTDETLSIAAYERLKVLNPSAPPSFVPRLRTMVQAALELLGERIARSPDYEAMQADFAFTPAAGVVDLSTQDGLIFLPGRSRVRVAATNAEIPEVDDALTMQDAGLPNDSAYFARVGRTLRFRSTTPSLDDYVTPVKVRTNYVPSLTDATRPLPVRFQGAAVESLANLGAAIKAEEMAA
jgi:hypothetical protein